MALDVQLSDFMPDTVTIHPYASFNNYGERAYGSTRTAKAYVERGITMSDTGKVESQELPVRVYVADTSITVRDKIVLASGAAPEVREVAVHTEVGGLDHTVVTFR
jgi:hypothetical protein